MLTILGDALMIATRQRNYNSQKPATRRPDGFRDEQERLNWWLLSFARH